MNNLIPTETNLLSAPAGANYSFKKSVADFFLCVLANRNTQRAYANDLRSLNSYLATQHGVSMQKACPAHVGAFRKHLEEAGYSVAGIQRKIATIRGFYSHLTSYGVITHSPAANL